ncbi:MAG: hypothetical protein OXJ63_06435 [Gammaproteobacteria bacterium]|nr:hypothetical protein [Gammaproteobacteria bacterium]
MNDHQQPLHGNPSHPEWQRFQHDVIVATDSLAYILDGISRIHRNPDGPIGGPKLRGFPMLTGESFRDRTRPYGPMMQTVFRGWFAEVFDLWESVYELRLSDSIDADGEFLRLERAVLEEFGQVRNNLLHGGVAMDGEAGNLRRLQWFKPGERMRMQFWHVLDFLNQMGWLMEDDVLILEEDRGPRTSRWHVERDRELEKIPPQLVSIRPLIDLGADDPMYRYGVGVAFDNGVFGNVPFGFEEAIDPVTPLQDRIRTWHAIEIDDNGNLRIPGVATVGARDLYQGCLAEPARAPATWMRVIGLQGHSI